MRRIGLPSMSTTEEQLSWLTSHFYVVTDTFLHQTSRILCVVFLRRPWLLFVPLMIQHDFFPVKWVIKPNVQSKNACSCFFLADYWLLCDLMILFFCLLLWEKTCRKKVSSPHNHKIWRPPFSFNGIPVDNVSVLIVNFCTVSCTFIGWTYSAGRCKNFIVSLWF